MKKVLLFITGFLIASVLHASSGRTEVINWLYAFTDNISGRAVFSNDNILWEKAKYPYLLHSAKKPYLLLKTNIDTYNYNDPVMVLEDVYLNIVVYDQFSLIYNHGFENNNGTNLSVKKVHIIDLKKNYQGEIYIVIGAHKGLPEVSSKIRIGEKNDIYSRASVSNIDDIVVSSILLFIGINLLIIAFWVSDIKKEFMILGLLLFTMGGYLLLRLINMGLIIEGNLFFSYSEYFLLYLSPVFLYMFIGKIWGYGKYGCIKKIIILHNSFLYFSIFSSLLGFIGIYETLNYFIFLIVLTLPLTAVKIFFSALKGHVDSKIFAAGLLTFMFFAVFEIISRIKYFGDNFFLLHVGMFLLSLSLVVVIMRRIINMSKSLKKITLKLEAYSDNLETMVYERTEELNNKNNELNIKNNELQKAYDILEENKMIIDNDLFLARNIQQNFLLENIPYSEDWEAAYKYLPYTEVSGDIYDFYKNSENMLSAIVLFDISGHGVSSGLITMIAKMIAFQKYKKFYDKPLSDYAYEINYELTEEIENVENYMTGVIIRLGVNSIEYVNCAHFDIFIKKSDSGKVEIISSENKLYKGSVLGYDKEMVLPEVINVNVNPGDQILIYTDGLIESAYRKNISEGISKLCNLFEQCPHDEPDMIIKYIVDKECDFSKSNCFDDDVTVICLKKK